MRGVRARTAVIARDHLPQRSQCSGLAPLPQLFVKRVVSPTVIDEHRPSGLFHETGYLGRLPWVRGDGLLEKDRPNMRAIQNRLQRLQSTHRRGTDADDLGS